MDAHRRRLERIALLVLGVLFAIGLWQSYGVLLYGIEGSYAH
jgi:hypothetical protein